MEAWKHGWINRMDGTEGVRKRGRERGREGGRDHGWVD